MVIREELVECIYFDGHEWSCPSIENCELVDCRECASNILAEYEQKIRAEAFDEYKHNLKETFNNEFPSNYHCTQPYFTLDNVRVLADAVAMEMKEKKNE